MQSPWQLPGPLRFFDTVSEKIAQGMSMVISRPLVVASGWEGAIERACHDSGRIVSWVEEDHPRRGDPLRLIDQEVLHLDGEPLKGQRFLDACKEAAAYDTLPVLALRCTEEAQFKTWAAHVANLETLQRIAAPRERVVIILERIGLLNVPPVRREGGISHLDWPWPFGEIDLAVWGHIHRPGVIGLRGRLAIQLAWALSGFDPDLCERLVTQELSTLLNPESVLRDFAEERGWTHDTSCSVWLGTEGVFRGKPIPHASWEVAAGVDPPHYRRRIWSAQVAIILPEIEEQRRAFIAKHSSKLILPWQDKEGRMIAEPMDCEVGHIMAMLSSKELPRMILPDSDRSWVRALWACRNDLSHLQSLTPAQIEQVERFGNQC